jgi:hypothetical protein
MTRNAKRVPIFNGEIQVPVLTMHTTGDGLVINENERATNHVVQEAGSDRLLRQTFVSLAWRCTFTPAETLPTVSVLLNRLKTGSWHDVDDNDLNGAAGALGPEFNIFLVGTTIVPTPPLFIEFSSGPYPRPFDALDKDKDDE